MYGPLVRLYAEVALWKVERRFFFYIPRRAKDPRGSTKARVAGRQSAWKGVIRDAGVPIKTHGSKSSPASATPRDRESVRGAVEKREGGGERRDPRFISAVIHLRGTFHRSRASETNYTRNWSCPVSKKRVFSISFRLRWSALSETPRSVHPKCPFPSGWRNVWNTTIRAQIKEKDMK